MRLKLIKCVSIVLYCAAIVLFSIDIRADEEAEIQQAIAAYQERPWVFGVAAGYGNRSNPLVNSKDIPLYAVIDIAWFGDWFFFDNGDVGITLRETDKLSVNLIAHVNNERGVFEWFNNSRLGVQFFPDGTFSPNPEDPAGPATDDNNPAGSQDENRIPEDKFSKRAVKPPKRDFAVDGGLEIIYADVWGDLQLQVLSDISNTHKGVEVWASYGYTWEYGNWKLTPSAGINWKSSHLLDYYYGVRRSEARDNRPAYEAGSGINSFARLAVSYRFNDHWGIVGVAEYESLSRSIRRSPIVNKDSIETFFVGIMYRF
ncbi:MAG TPA: MipA/OmpV family protein [Crenotrichaceae bacterium]|nr:MipA/OmpV family protein [Crenotrichaceae bacterium]